MKDVTPAKPDELVGNVVVHNLVLVRADVDDFVSGVRIKAKSLNLRLRLRPGLVHQDVRLFLRNHPFRHLGLEIFPSLEKNRRALITPEPFLLHPYFLQGT